MSAVRKTRRLSKLRAKDGDGSGGARVQSTTIQVQTGLRRDQKRSRNGQSNLFKTSLFLLIYSTSVFPICLNRGFLHLERAVHGVDFLFADVA